MQRSPFQDCLFEIYLPELVGCTGGGEERNYILTRRMGRAGSRVEFDTAKRC